MPLTDIEKWGRDLNNWIPFLGTIKRRAACKKLANDSSSAAVPHLVEAYESEDPKVKETAGRALRTLMSRRSIDALCDAIIKNPKSKAAAIVIEMNYQHQSISRRCLVLLVTGRIQQYLDLDYELHFARSEYQSGDGQLRHNIATIVRESKDPRLQGIILAHTSMGGFSKPAKELTEREADTAVDVHARRGEWKSILSFLFHIPTSSVVRALHVLSNSGWQPDSTRDERLLHQLLAIHKNIGNIRRSPLDPITMLGPVIGRWIQDGHAPEMYDAAIDDIRQRLRAYPAPEATAALSALSEHGQVSEEDMEAALTHKHWPVRLASLALCEISPETAFSHSPAGGCGGEIWTHRISTMLIETAVHRSRAINMNEAQLEELQKRITAKSISDPVLLEYGKLISALASYRIKHSQEIDERMIVRVDDLDLKYD